jgi:hypothetical protein
MNLVKARKDRGLIIVTPRNSLKFALNTGMRNTNWSNSRCDACLQRLGSKLGLKFKRRARVEEKDNKHDHVMLVDNKTFKDVLDQFTVEDMGTYLVNLKTKETIPSEASELIRAKPKKNAIIEGIKNNAVKPKNMYLNSDF